MAVIAFAPSVASRAACIQGRSRTRLAVPGHTASRNVVVRAAQHEAHDVSRRQLAAAAVVAASLLSATRPAHAFLGFGDDKAEEAAYQQRTAAVLESVNNAIALGRDVPDRDDQIRAVRSEINAWVARYRRDVKFSGRPSYGNTYSALNALAGHYNSFGTQAPIPKKRLERLSKELGDAQLLLARNR